MRRRRVSVFRLPLAVGGHDVAVDLGTANTVLYARGGASLISEPSIVAVNSRTGELEAVGSEASQILGRQEISIIRPLSGGVIADLTATEELLRCLLEKVQSRRWTHPRVVASVATGVSGIEQRAVAEACLSAGARETYLIEKPVAAALGVGLPVEQPTGSMVLEVGAGSSEVAVVSMGSIVISRSLRIGGDELDQSIVGHLKRHHQLLIGPRTAEQIKLEIGSASPYAEPETQLPICGREIASDALKTVPLTSEEIRWVLQKPISRIIDAVMETLDRTPPALGADIIDRGITLTGGGSLLHGLAQRLEHETGMPARVAQSPATRVVVGSAIALEGLADVPRSRSSARHELALGTTAAFN